MRSAVTAMPDIVPWYCPPVGNKSVRDFVSYRFDVTRTARAGKRQTLAS